MHPARTIAAVLFLLLFGTGLSARAGGKKEAGPIRSEAFAGFVQPREAAVLAGHSEDTNALAFSPDGKWLASAGDDKLVKLWDVATGKEKASFKGHKGDVKTVVFAAGGKLVVSGGEGEKVIRLWDVAAGKARGTLEGHDDDILSLAVTSDGQTLASASRDRTVKLWGLRTGKEISKFETRGTNSVAITPDGKTLVFGASRLEVWDVAGKKLRHRLEGHTQEINAIAISPDGKLLVSGSRDGACKLWDLAAGKEKFSFVFDRLFGPTSFAFSPDGNILAIGTRSSPAIWLLDPKSGKGGLAFKYAEGHGRALAFSPDGKTLALTYQKITLMPAASLTVVPPLAERQALEGHSSPVRSLAISPDGKTLASGGEGELAGKDRYKGVIKLWDLATGKVRATLEGHGNSVLGLAFTPDGKHLVSGSYDRTVKVWDLATRKAIRTLRTKRYVWPVAVSPSGKWLAAGGEDGDWIVLWDLATGKELRTLPGHRNNLMALAFSPDSSTLASSGMDRTVKLWDAATGKELATLKGHDGWVISLAFTPDGKTLASGSWDNTVKLWNVATHKERAALKTGTSQGAHVRFSKNGRLLVVGGPDLGTDGRVSAWDMTTGRELARARWESGLLWSLAVTPDGKTVATGFGNKIKLWAVPPPPPAKEKAPNR